MLILSVSGASIAWWISFPLWVLLSSLLFSEGGFKLAKIFTQHICTNITLFFKFNVGINMQYMCLVCGYALDIFCVPHCLYDCRLSPQGLMSNCEIFKMWSQIAGPWLRKGRMDYSEIFEFSREGCYKSKELIPYSLFSRDTFLEVFCNILRIPGHTSLWNLAVPDILL